MRGEGVTTSEQQQRELFFSGTVQGVGFRYTARALARGYRIAGFVRNLPDARVQLVVEGDPGEIQNFLSDLQAELGHYITRKTETVQPADGRFHGFEIRF